MSEHLKYLGRRQELEIERKSLEIRIQGLIKNLRDALDPMAPIEELDPESIGEWSAALAEARGKYRNVIADLKKLEGILGK
jgi:ribosome maturation protein Sdo1